MASDKYEQYVLPYLDKVEELASNGCTYAEISSALGIHERTMYNYFQKYPDLRAAIIMGRQTVVKEVKRAMLKKALGFEYEEKRTITKRQGDEEIVTEEIVTKYSAPSEGAAQIILRNADKSYLDRDQTSVDLKQREVELKEKIADSNYFFDGDCADVMNNDGECNEKESELDG